MDLYAITEEIMGHCKGVIDEKYKVYCTIGDGQFAKYYIRYNVELNWLR